MNHDSSSTLVLASAGMKLAEYERSVVIERPIADVFAFTSSRAGFEAHFPHAVRRWKGEETFAIGNEFTFDYKMMGLWLGWKGRVVAFEENVMFRDLMLEGTFKAFEHTHLFESLGPSSTRYTDSLRFSLGFAGLLDEWLGKRMIDATFSKRHVLLKAALEGSK